jgi:hypothetical protein
MDGVDDIAAKANALAKRCVHGRIIGWACLECGRPFDTKALQELYDTAKAELVKQPGEMG